MPVIEDMKRINFLREFLSEHDLTPRKAEEILGVSQRTIERMLTNESRITDKTILLCAYYANMVQGRVRIVTKEDINGLLEVY